VVHILKTVTSLLTPDDQVKKAEYIDRKYGDKIRRGVLGLEGTRYTWRKAYHTRRLSWTNSRARMRKLRSMRQTPAWSSVPTLAGIINEYSPFNSGLSKVCMSLITGSVSTGRGFFDPPIPQKALTKCQNCGHLDNNHIQYGNTSWSYCKTCLRYNKDSECV